MFTGIIEEIGTITTIEQSGEAMKLAIKSEKILTDIHIGDSISVNGICLTVTSFTTNTFTVDVMPETFRTTSLRTSKRNSKVNLERAMAAKGRFGGHFVSGHIDGVGLIKSKKTQDNAVYYQIELPSELLRYCLLKGSIAIDGTSLTIFGVDETGITISLIPHTLNKSIIGEKDVNDLVNIECDLIGKYIERFVSNPTSQNSSISEEFLQKKGFI